MANLTRITTEGENAVAAATLETVLQARGITTAKYELAEMHITSDYPTDPTGVVYWYLAYQSTDGTATGCTEVPSEPDDPTPALTGFRAFTVEPTPGNLFASGHFNVNGGQDSRYWAEGDGEGLDNATTSRIALVVTSDKACNVAADLAFRPKAF